MLPVSSRPGKLNSAWATFLGSAAVLAILIALLAGNPLDWFARTEAPRPVVVYCAAGIKLPVESAAREYEAAYGVPVQLQYGGSQTLLANIDVSGGGGLYLPADDGYLQLARDKELLDEVIPLAQMRPVLAVPKGNPRGVRSLRDLLDRRLRIVHANPDAAAVGKLAKEALSKSGHWERFRRRIVSDKFTVNDVANDIVVGAADAGIVWDATVRQYPGLEAVRAPQLEKEIAHISVGVLRGTEQPSVALRFARYLGARGAGLAHFARHGFTPVEGDDWEEAPEVLLHAGAMLRPAIEETINAFEEREGVSVTRVYNGCGILVAGMKASKQRRPDAYFACDQEFMDQVADLFDPPAPVSSNQLVILVRKDYRHKDRVRKLRDLALPGLRVGIGHEKQCAMGVLTQETLKQTGTRPDVMANVVVQSPTGDMLVNQLRTGSLDAAIAYLSNAAGAQDVVEARAIDIKCAFATQPFAIGKTSRHKDLTERLLGAIRSRQSRDRFEAMGFTWGPRSR
jgi:molybdenum ABC transporter molybdate-binding protein